MVTNSRTHSLKYKSTTSLETDINIELFFPSLLNSLNETSFSLSVVQKSTLVSIRAYSAMQLTKLKIAITLCKVS